MGRRISRRVNRKNTRRVNRKNTMRKKTRRVNRKNTLSKKTRRVNRKNTKLFGGVRYSQKDAETILWSQVHPHRYAKKGSTHYQQAQETYFEIRDFLENEEKINYDRYFK
jgi:flagellar biosynthesis/type III secretory pathway chaperone